MMKILFSAILWLCLIALPFTSNSQQEAFHRVKASIPLKMLRQFQQQDLIPDHCSYENGVFIAEMPESDIKSMEASGIRFNYLVRDIASATVAINQKIDAQHGFSGLGSPALLSTAPAHFTYGSMGGHYTYAEAMNVLDQMRAAFPDLVSQKDTIGYTYEGRPLVAVRISDNPDLNEAGEEEWMMTAMHHANEVIGMSVLYYYVWHLLENYDSNPEYKRLLNHSALYILPVLNPDGLAFNESTNPAGGGTWRKNRKPRVVSGTTHYGVDLNRNYGFKWAYNSVGQSGSNFAGNNYYRGTAAWSELETAAVRDFTLSHQFVSAINFHAWDDSFNFPWNFETDSMPNDSSMMRAISHQYADSIDFQQGHFDYTLGYTANGTSDDWLYGDSVSKPKVYAFTVEIGKSFWPASTQIAAYCDSLLKANVDMLRMSNRYAVVSSSGPATLNQLTNKIGYTLKRYSIKPNSFTVSLLPISSNISAVGGSTIFSNIEFLATATDTISLELDPSITDGDTISYAWEIDNGTWSYRDTVSLVYQHALILPLGCDDNLEPNNLLSTARPIAAGLPLKGAISSATDEDYYSIDLPTSLTTNIRVILSGLPADFDLALFDAQGKRIVQSQQGYRNNDTLVWNNASGNYYLQVTGYQHAYSSENCYTLLWEQRSQPFALPQTPAKLPAERYGETWSCFPNPAQQQLTVRWVAARYERISWQLLGANGGQVAQGSWKAEKGYNQFVLPTGKYARGTYFLLLRNEAGKQSYKQIQLNEY